VRVIIIALGANLPGPYGNPGETLRHARQALAGKGIRVTKASRQWLTEPVPVSDHPWYRNAVVAVETVLSPRELLTTLKEIERAAGRVLGEQNAPRALDLDLIAYGDHVITEKDLSVPHPRMHERAFVLLPLREIAPGWRHPGLRKSLAELITALPPGQKAEALEEAA
jgi:2-amino-4-hydroxy-6-hydroxymethyldihydropteridine diphosphokinase